jgi:hypothetical protein
LGAVGITIFSPAARDWIPCLLILLFYSQAGQFVTRVGRGAEGVQPENRNAGKRPDSLGASFRGCQRPAEQNV